MLIYGYEVVLPVENAIYTHLLTTFKKDLNKALTEVLDLLPLVRGNAHLQEEIATIKMNLVLQS